MLLHSSFYRLAWFIASLAFAACLILIWDRISAAGLVKPIFLPSPGKVWTALVAGMWDGSLLRATLITTARTLGGWLIASLIGIVLGAVIGLSAKARIYIGPTLEALRPLPVASLVPILIALMGYSEQMVLSVVAIGALWPTLLNTVSGFQAVEPRLYEVAQVLRMRRHDVLIKIALPSALPEIIAGMRVGLTVSLILVVVGEILGSRPGLGYTILLAQRTFHTADLFAGIAILGLIGFVTASLLNMIEHKLVYWKH
jgi:ABC-type nitrate/sulfonate/bicarbonate transport system permease component